MKSNLIDIEARLVHETEKAWRLTNELRWREYYRLIDHETATLATVLEQMWIADDGEIEWREVPTVMP